MSFMFMEALLQAAHCESTGQSSGETTALNHPSPPHILSVCVCVCVCVLSVCLRCVCSACVSVCVLSVCVCVCVCVCAVTREGLLAVSPVSVQVPRVHSQRRGGPGRFCSL